MDQAGKLYDLIEEVHHKILQFWSHHVLFSWQWWLGVGLTIIPWLLWFIFRKKESTFRLLTAGLFAILISSWLDFVGIAFGLWHYNYDVLPFLPSYLPWDFTLIPVIIMFIIQYKPDLSPYLKALFFAVVTAFIGEPIFNWLNTYSPEEWKYIYSFPIFFVIYLLSHWIATKEAYERLKS